MSGSNWRSDASSEILLERALMLKNIRAFFESREVTEVETPLLSHASTTDPHLDSLRSQFRGQVCFLNTSPEYAMKRLLASWGAPIYQICKAFRDDELGINHNPEFTMLEWYRPGYDMRQLMDELAALLKTLCVSSRVLSNDVAEAEIVFDYISYQQAFMDYVGIDPHKASSSTCRQATLDNGIEIPQGLGEVEEELDDWLDWLLTQLVLPRFKTDRFTFLYDYPVSQCSLAKIASNDEGELVAKRFECFFGEVELANGFHELTDAEEQLRRFQSENQLRQQAGKAISRIDERFIAALNHGLPECSGVAMGLDRLLMVLTKESDIKRVLTFSWEKA